jgi:small-conductance mechanosensitive channel
VAAILLAAGALPATAADPADPEAVATAPVVIDGVPLFELRGATAFPAERRAREVRERILNLASSPSFDPASLAVVNLPNEAHIVGNGVVIVRVLDADTEMEDLARSVLAETYAQRIRQSVQEYRAARTEQALLGAAWRGILVTALAILLLVALQRLFVHLDRWLARRLAARERGITFRTFEIFQPRRLYEIGRRALGAARTLILLGLGLFYLGYMLALFPPTRATSTQVLGWVLAPLRYLGEGLLARLPDLVFLTVLFFVVRWGLGLIRLFFDAVGRGEVTLGEFEREWAAPTYNIVRLFVLAFAVVIAYPYIPGSSTAAFKGVSVFLGVVVSVGSSSMVANWIAGYTMIYRRAFRAGDIVQVGDVLGMVGVSKLQVTTVRTPKNEMVAIPNATMASSEIVNYSTLANEQGLILHTSVGIGYGTPWRQVEALLIEAAARTPGLLTEPKPYVFLLDLGTFAVSYELNVYCNDPARLKPHYSALHRQILDVFSENGVQIMTPAYEGDPEAPKIAPPEHRRPAPAKEE